MGYINGVRNRFDYTDAMFCNSLFYYHMLEHGLDVYKDTSTRDIICIDFAYKTRSYEQEVAHLKSRLKLADTEDKKRIIEDLLKSAEENKYKFKEMSKDEIRLNFYENGVPVAYRTVDKKTGEISEKKIVYKMLYRNPSKAKVGQCMFINEELYDDAVDWLSMGLYNRFPPDNAKIVELSAYMPLSTSTIIDRFHMTLDEVLILDDEDSYFHTIADVIKSADYNTVETIIDEEATLKEKQKAIDNGKIDIYGNPIYRPVTKKQSCVKKRCVVSREETDVSNTVWDGMALIESSFAHGDSNGMVLLRNHFFKACAFKCHIQKFFQDYCRDNNIDYNTFQIEDIFGRKILAKNIKLITNKDACKWWKFIDLMGETKLAAYEYWRSRLEADNNTWGIVKEDHPSKLGDNHEIQQLSYQAINTLPCSKDDIFKIAETSINYIYLLKENNDEFKKFLIKNSTAVNHYEMLAALYDWNPNFAETDMWKNDKSKIIRAYIQKLRKGKITVCGDNLTMCGNPYALLLYAVGEDWENDPTLAPEDGVIQCYTPRFEDGEYLCAIRSPHNAPSNTTYLKNVRHSLMEKYMDFSNNIIAVNCIHTDVQARLNGADFDADSVLVTNQPEMVNAAMISYRDYPTVVNAISQSGKTYKNKMSEYAKMDSAANRAQMGIGQSSNLAQLALSYLWTKRANGIDDEECVELYHNCIILAVLAQILIDGIKRSFDVDALAEIERIQNTTCMIKHKEVIINGKKKIVKCDLPEFMKYIREVPLTKDGKELPYSTIKKEQDKLNSRIDSSIICPMNWLQECLDGIRGASRSKQVPVESFYIKKPGNADNRQMGRIRQIVEKYDAWTKANIRVLNTAYDSEENPVEIFIEKTEKVLNSIRSYKISEVTMNRLIGSALGVETTVAKNKKYKNATKYTRKMLNLLYRYDKEKFLKNFKKP